jgi:1,4-dihydroxy-2-naphthoate octaprenyltransferase
MAAQAAPAALAFVLDGRSALCWLLMLACGVLMQSATNTLNDYQDFASGLDTTETVLDKTDASIVYNQINPLSARAFALVLLGVAFVLGMLVALLSSLVLIIWGFVAAAVAVLYSFGPRPLSSLPAGELASGVVMGGILTCTTFYAMTLHFSSAVFAVALVTTIGIAQIMLTNNTCDIDRDLIAGRRTLPSLLGRSRARVLNASLGVFCFVWLVLALVWMGLPFGMLAALVGVALCLRQIYRLFAGPYTLTNRRVMMRTVVSYNAVLDASVVVALLVGGATYAIV